MSERDNTMNNDSRAELKLPLPQPFHAIGIKWIAYAQEDHDTNDIAHAIWSAIHEATIAQQAQPVQADLLQAAKRVVRWLDHANCSLPSSDDGSESMRADMNSLRALAYAQPVQQSRADFDAFIDAFIGAANEAGITELPVDAQQERDSQDAERYRWLKMTSSPLEQHEIMQTPWGRWDAYIDAALAQGERNG